MSSLEKFNRSIDFFSNPEKSKAIMQSNAEGKLSFGIGFLDDALLGIQKNDLILLGAPSGAGKTELASHIAFSNAAKDKKVVYFALEAEAHEIENRVLYKHKATEYYRKGGKIYTSYDVWIQGGCPHLDEIAIGSEQISARGLKTRYINEAYTIKNFLIDYTEIVNSSDLVILDHIHYFDLETENENKEYKEIIKKIRSQVLEYGKPIIVISHIRKRDRRYPVIAPDQEDFHGTSDLVKVATKVISMSPQYEVKMFRDLGSDMHSPLPGSNYTFMKIAKNRRNGSVCRYIGATKYDPRTNAYQNDYFLGTQKTKDKELIFLTETDPPEWAKSSI